MKTGLGILGWIVAALGIAATVTLYSANQSLKAQLAQANANLAVPDIASSDTPTGVDAPQASGAMASDDDADTVDPAEAIPSEDGEEDAAGESTDVQPDPEETAENDTPDQGDSMRRAARAQMGVMVGMTYNPLLDRLALPAETRESVNDILIDAFQEAQQATVQDMMSGSTTAKEAKAKQDAIDAKIREQLTDVLNEEQMAEWDTYQDFADEVLYESLLDGQLAMLAPNLSDEARETAKIVLAEELAAELDRFYETDAVYTLDTFNQAQLAGLNNGMAKMPDTVDEEQYTHLTGFIDQVESAFQQMAGQSGQAR